MPEHTVECEVCHAATVRLLRYEGEVEVWACQNCGDLKRWCPRCDQGWIRRLRDPADDEVLFSCDECDATWPEEGPIGGVGVDLQTYLRRAGKPWSYMRLTNVREPGR